MARGSLRIYLGAAPGVGKTFAMLNEGWRRHERGTDVVVGFVETHGRALTAAQIRDLEVVPRRQVAYRGQHVRGDGRRRGARPSARGRARRRARPHERAGMRATTKRWQDIEQLLAAGIDVISTVNIQHLESLNDVVERITGIVQRETVPDAVVRAAEQIELVDMTPEALRRRMAHGNIYHGREGRRRARHYFRLGNLGALRELALLWVADRVDESLERVPRTPRHHRALGDPGTRGRRARPALRAASCSSAAARGWRHARTPSSSACTSGSADGLASPDDGLLERHRSLLDELGGRYVEVAGADPADALVRFARAENATQIILGSSHRSRWAELTKGSVINQVIRTAASDRRARHLGRRRAGSAYGDTAPSVPPAGATVARPTALAWIGALVGIPFLVLMLIPLRDAMGVPGTLLLLLLGPVAVACCWEACCRRSPRRSSRSSSPTGSTSRRRTASGSRTSATPSPWSCSWRSRRW